MSKYRVQLNNWSTSGLVILGTMKITGTVSNHPTLPNGSTITNDIIIGPGPQANFAAQITPGNFVETDVYVYDLGTKAP